ncbi:MAG: hypothetical protein IJP16_06940 [Clostridia bacterium]|nr:hypothetical protein [Clostridia bacterium]
MYYNLFIKGCDGKSTLSKRFKREVGWCETLTPIGEDHSRAAGDQALPCARR